MMNNRQPEEFASGKDAFEFVSGVFLWAISILGVFWALVVKRQGTVGTRIHWMDVGLCWLGMLAMSGDPAAWMFRCGLVVLPILWLMHLAATMRSKEHVHTMCIGTSIFPFEESNAALLEFILGIALGAAAALYCDYYFGWFIGLSAISLAIRLGMIEERDRRRAVQMEDAMAEQAYMMRTMEKFRK